MLLQVDTFWGIPHQDLCLQKQMGNFKTNFKNFHYSCSINFVIKLYAKKKKKKKKKKNLLK